MRKLRRMKHVTRPLVTTLLSFSMVMLLAGAARAALDCTKCHGTNLVDAHPVDTPAGSLPTYRNITTGAVKGNHSTHSSPSLIGQACVKCHGGVAASYTSKHAVLNHYSIQISPSVRYIKYSTAGLNPGVTSFAQTPAPVLGYCSNASCHFESRSPVWGSDPLGAVADLNSCSTCHNALPSTGSHTVHIAEHGNNLNACTNCHSDHSVEAKPFQHATSVGRPIAIISFRGYSGPGSNSLYLPSQKNDRTLGYCSTAYCHDDGLGNGAASLTESPVWGASVAKCTVCHPSRPITGRNTIQGAR